MIRPPGPHTDCPSTANARLDGGQAILAGRAQRGERGVLEALRGAATAAHRDYHSYPHCWRADADHLPPMDQWSSPSTIRPPGQAGRHLRQGAREIERSTGPGLGRARIERRSNRPPTVHLAAALLGVPIPRLRPAGSRSSIARIVARGRLIAAHGSKFGSADAAELWRVRPNDWRARGRGQVARRSMSDSLPAVVKRGDRHPRSAARDAPVGADLTAASMRARPQSGTSDPLDFRERPLRKVGGPACPAGRMSMAMNHCPWRGR